MKFDLDNLKVSENFYTNTEILQKEVINRQEREIIQNKLVINSTAEALIFLKMNLPLFKECFKNDRYSHLHNKILWKIHYIYQDADHKKLSKELNKNFILSKDLLVFIYFFISYVLSLVSLPFLIGFTAWIFLLSFFTAMFLTIIIMLSTGIMDNETL